MRIAETFEIAVLLTNQVQSSPDSIFNENSFKATRGNIMAHSTTYRIFLRKSGRNRILRMVDSPYHAERDILFTICEGGICDPKNHIYLKKYIYLNLFLQIFSLYMSIFHLESIF